MRQVFYVRLVKALWPFVSQSREGGRPHFSNEALMGLIQVIGGVAVSAGWLPPSVVGDIDLSSTAGQVAKLIEVLVGLWATISGVRDNLARHRAAEEG